MADKFDPLDPLGLRDELQKMQERLYEIGLKLPSFPPSEGMDEIGKELQNGWWALEKAVGKLFTIGI